MDTSISDSADYLSANSFINAYLREFDDWRLGTSPQSWQDAGFPEQVLIIPMGRQTLWVGVEYWSQCGRHRFVMPARCEFVDNGHCRRVRFLCLAKMLVENAALQTNGTIGAMARLLERIMESHRNLEMILALRDSEVEPIFRQPLSFLQAEQSLLSGHSTHPAAKACQPMTLTEAVQYGAEGGNGFALAWLLVRDDRLHYHSADHLSLQQRVTQLLESDALLDSVDWEIPAGYSLIPAHPWQLARLQSLPQLQRAFAERQIMVLAPRGQHWHGTSSMRTVYADHAPYMLKFSLGVRLTNSVRHLLPEEAERGILVSKMLATETGQQFNKRFTQFDIMREPAYLCLLDDTGNPIAESTMLFRDNPMGARQDVQYNLLAAITQDHPTGEQSRLASLVREVAFHQRSGLAQAARCWFMEFLEVAIKPVLLAQADYGLLLNAHQQNLVLGLRDGMPVHSYYRDCRTVGVSDVGIRLFKLDKDVVNESSTEAFGYCLVVNSLFSIISTMGADGLIDEAVLLADLQAFFKLYKTNLRRDCSFILSMLEGEALYQRANFHDALAERNEGTAQHRFSRLLAVSKPRYTVQSEPAPQVMLAG